MIREVLRQKFAFLKAHILNNVYRNVFEPCVMLLAGVFFYWLGLMVAWALDPSESLLVWSLWLSSLSFSLAGIFVAFLGFGLLLRRCLVFPS